MRLFASIVGYVLLLAQRLMRNTNLVNARPMLLLTKAAWYEQTLWVTYNINGQQDLELSVRLAEGAGAMT